MMKIDGHDDAIIGPALIWRNNTMVSVLVYDAEVIRNTLVTRDAMAFDDAREYIESNIEGAYVGEGTPVLVWPYDMWDEE
jgi:hypothetical protein